MLEVLVDRDQGQRQRAKLRIRQLLQCLLYSVDPEVQFNRMTAIERKRKDADNKKKAQDKRYLKTIGIGTPKFSLELAKGTAMVQHMKQRLLPGCIYSFPH